jgi:hypothetical protein
VALNAGDFGFVFGASLFHLLDKGQMAFLAVGDLESSPDRSGGGSNCRFGGRFGALGAAGEANDSEAQYGSGGQDD